MNACLEPGAKGRMRLKQHYDALGSGQDAEAWYEDPALDELCRWGSFEDARNVVEIGCGTGRFAARLLRDHMAPDAGYFGLDLSPVMAGLSQDRLEPFGDRCRIVTGDVLAGLPIADGSVDRVVAAFVLDLLPRQDIFNVLNEVRRVLVPDGLFCAASLAPGQTAGQRISGLGWRIIQWLTPLRVGGCRPLSLPGLLQNDWCIQNYVQCNIKNIATASICAQPFSA